MAPTFITAPSISESLFIWIYTNITMLDSRYICWDCFSWFYIVYMVKQAWNIFVNTMQYWMSVLMSILYSIYSSMWFQSSESEDELFPLTFPLFFAPITTSNANRVIYVTSIAIDVSLHWNLMVWWCSTKWTARLFLVSVQKLFFYSQMANT